MLAPADAGCKIQDAGWRAKRANERRRRAGLLCAAVLGGQGNYCIGGRRLEGGAALAGQRPALFCAPLRFALSSTNLNLTKSEVYQIMK